MLLPTIPPVPCPLIPDLRPLRPRTSGHNASPPFPMKTTKNPTYVRFSKLSLADKSPPAEAMFSRQKPTSLPKLPPPNILEVRAQTLAPPTSTASQHLRTTQLMLPVNLYSIRCRLFVALFVCTFASSAVAQEGPAGLRAIAPGVLTTIPPQLEPDETLHAHPVMEIRADKNLDWTPEFLPPSRTLFAMAKMVQFDREVWGLEFVFKPLRIIEVDVPQASGRMQRKKIWYLVYQIRNTGAGLKPVAEGPGLFSTSAAEPVPRRFLPKFVFEAHDLDNAGKKNYRA